MRVALFLVQLGETSLCETLEKARPRRYELVEDGRDGPYQAVSDSPSCPYESRRCTVLNVIRLRWRGPLEKMVGGFTESQMLDRSSTY